VPVQIIARARDAVVPLINAEFLYQRLPHSRLGIVDAGHFAWEDAASEYAALIASWWDEGGTYPGHNPGIVPGPAPGATGADRPSG
jgi:hypothetical protein